MLSYHSLNNLWQLDNVLGIPPQIVQQPPQNVQPFNAAWIGGDSSLLDSFY